MKQMVLPVVAFWFLAAAAHCAQGKAKSAAGRDAGAKPGREAGMDVAVPGITSAEIEPGPGMDAGTPGKKKPAIDPARPITLAEAMRAALAGNPEVAVTAGEVRVAQEERRIASSQLWPQVHGVAGYNRFQDSQRIIPPSMNNQVGAFGRDIFTSDLVVRMPLFTGGRIRNEIKAAELMRLAARHGLQRTRRELVFNVASVFYGLLSQEKVIASVSFSLKTLDKHEQRVRSMMEVQKAARVDLLRTRVRVANLRERLVREKNLRLIHARLLASLMGIEPSHGHDLRVSVDLEFYVQNKAAAVKTGIALARALRMRSDYLAAQAVVRAQEKRVNVARARRWPQLNLQGSYGGRWGVDPTQDPASADDAGDEGRVGMTLDVPLFEGGRITAGIRREEARLEIARQQLRKLKLRINLEVETAALNVESARERIKATRTAVTQARESLRIEQEKYTLGRGAITDVLDAQSELLDAQTRYFQALADWHVARYQLRLATGGAIEGGEVKERPK